MKLNWDYLEYELKKQGWSAKQYAMKKLRRSNSYLSAVKTGRMNLPENVLEFMIKDLNLNRDILFENVKTYNIKEEAKEELPPLESDFEIEVRAALKEINEKIDLLMELDDKLTNILKHLPQKTPLEKAVDLLNRMHSKAGRCEYNDFVIRLGMIGLDKDVADEAIKKTEATLKVSGYGNGKKTWIIRKANTGTETVQKEAKS